LHAFACFSECVKLRQVIEILVVAVTPLVQAGKKDIVVGRVFDGMERGEVSLIIVNREVDSGMCSGWW